MFAMGITLSMTDVIPSTAPTMWSTGDELFCICAKAPLACSDTSIICSSIASVDVVIDLVDNSIALFTSRRVPCSSRLESLRGIAVTE